MNISCMDKIAINSKSQKLLFQLLNENPQLATIISNSKTPEEVNISIKNWIYNVVCQSPKALSAYHNEKNDRNIISKLKWKDFAAIRILDYINHSDTEYSDPNLRGNISISNPFKQIWLAAKYGSGGANSYFFIDMIQLFKQFRGEQKKIHYSKETATKWMNKWPSGLDTDIIELRKESKNRIIKILIKKIDNREISDSKYYFEKDDNLESKYKKMLEWWQDKTFLLRFAIRTPELLNEMLDYSLDTKTMEYLHLAKKAGIPFFVNPYYLSLLLVPSTSNTLGNDFAIRQYILYSKELINEFGHISAWEKEDIIEPGKPNIAGWILPSQKSVHRRYPEVAILIPKTVGRACGGLCSICQRMYDFQRGNLNFNLKKLQPNKSWPNRLNDFMNYWENDSQLRDILITGGDALMSSNKTLKELLDAVYEMSLRKKEANLSRKEGEKYAEIQRIRLGTRLPVYLPQRIDESLIKILKDFKNKALLAGISQFVIQTHITSSMEVTPESKSAIKKLLSAGWIVTNQLVFTTAASRRGHSANLRKTLNDIGVLNYYTFTVKGYMENSYCFATNARAVQEQIEEKSLGEIPENLYNDIKDMPNHSEIICNKINDFRQKADIPFLATDRNVLNLPGIGKSLSFRTIGITRYGRRILLFDHDHTRRHSPIIKKFKKIIIIESKPVGKYLKQIENMGENPDEYKNIFGYSMGCNEKRIPIFTYPDFDFEITEEISNLDTEI